MERKTNPDVHVICGKCGRATMMTFKLNFDDEQCWISLSCDNCSTLTGLDEVIEDKTDWSTFDIKYII